MKAMLLRKPAPVETSPLEMAELPLPAPGPGEIRIQVRACGICHTDLHIVEGELTLPRLPVVPGHQIVGIVDARGKGVSRFREGDRVGVPWLGSTCGRCIFCQQGNENLCDQARFTGYHADGGYAQYALAREAFALALPGPFPDVAAAPLLCAGVIGFRAFRLSGVRRGERLGLYGFGASAHIVIQVAIHKGCQVYVFTRGEEHRQLARRLGAVWAGGAEDDPGARMESSIIFAPAGGLVPEALRLLRKGGSLILAGIYMSPIPVMDYQLLYQERSIRSVANSTRQDAQELLRLAAEIPLHTEVEEFPLAEANRALQLLKQGRIRGAGVLRIP